ncbi:DUF317 domain-containing protein [Streptomyces carpaticus]|uniref:DUF317 domain-containing protein n=1 Tax=Streptomyces carpaticus TaxID=285558 RepID=A0ABV4ZJX8_9ACTN
MKLLDFSRLPPDADLLVSPVYLAGTGDSSSITTLLDNAEGWTKTAVEDRYSFSGPHETLGIVHLPDHLSGGWKITAEPSWMASFSRRTPAEIVLAFTTTLLNGLPSQHRDYLVGGPRYHPATPATTLKERGWEPETTTRAHHQRSPDGYAALSIRLGSPDFDAELAGEAPAQWAMHGGIPKVPELNWHADFTRGTPLYLLTAATRALSTPTPVRRNVSDFPIGHLPYLDCAERAPSPRSTAALNRTTASTPRPQQQPSPAAPPHLSRYPARHRDR